MTQQYQLSKSASRLNARNTKKADRVNIAQQFRSFTQDFEAGNELTADAQPVPSRHITPY